MSESARFKYNMDFEFALCHLLGDKYYGTAGAFSDVETSKAYLRRAIKRIRKRLNEINTMDERLLVTTSIALTNLDENVKLTSEKVNNDWSIISNLLKLVALLIGYDWHDGKIHRHIFYHQDRQQEIEDHKNQIGDSAFWDEYRGDTRIRYEMVYLLNERKLPKYQIARVLNISTYRVTKILKHIDEYEKETGKKISLTS